MQQTIIKALGVLSLIINIVFFFFGLSLYSENEQLEQDASFVTSCRQELERSETDLEQCRESGSSVESENPAPGGDQFYRPILEDESLPVTVILDIKAYAQTHPASCEAASTHAVVSYFGSDLSENEIIEQVGADDGERYMGDDGKLYWGNPQEKFVGDIDGENVYVDGYGVYNQPIYEVLKQHGFAESISKTEWVIADLLSYVKRGFPAIVWISNDYSKKDVGIMVDEDGNENPWIWGEHAVVLRGVEGSKLHIMDVGNGSFYTVSKSEFETGFANLNNMAIVVIPDKKIIN